ncbi:response regulator transcription factor [Bacillus aquiflavi]|uniref:Response regulator transcription factor n=1 Tax=Bacillus aquiflavi TaxID=2672567 RepID=A0A6B3W0C5_9BACI|nr:response regulator transcription factor [Bacillus aquiflavi]MBA4537116.1 response regulator transcription factor [Bacillus aquiflavi]NEY81413.1 response regulator transcription factor [Bacillus aquiflavi]
MNKANILLVDDEKAIVKMIETVLKKEGFRNIFTAHTAQDALDLVTKKNMDIIVLDVMLPDQSGFDICPKIREICDAHILFLTAKVSDLDILTGFAIGADDYVTKPFNPLEIAARIKARLRRGNLTQITQNNETTKKRYDFGRFIVDEIAGELIVEGKVVPCPAQVFLLLLHFCKNPNRVFSKAQLFEQVWGFDSLVDDNTVMVHIRRIRERIEPNPSNPYYLLTVRGLGYKLVKER